MPETLKPQRIRANLSIGISEHKQNPSATVKGGETVAVLKNNKPEFYAVPARKWEQILDLLEDLEDIKLAIERKDSIPAPITLDELAAL